MTAPPFTSKPSSTTHGPWPKVGDRVRMTAEAERMCTLCKDRVGSLPFYAPNGTRPYHERCLMVLPYVAALRKWSKAYAGLMDHCDPEDWQRAKLAFAATERLLLKVKR